jgi:hypothetical protein
MVVPQILVQTMTAKMMKHANPIPEKRRKSFLLLQAYLANQVSGKVAMKTTNSTMYMIGIVSAIDG